MNKIKGVYNLCDTCIRVRRCLMAGVPLKGYKGRDKCPDYIKVTEGSNDR